MKKNLLFVLLILLGAGCNMSTSGPTIPPISMGTPGPQTWIDAPLNNMHIPLAPYEVVFHATDTGGVIDLELIINDQVISVSPQSTPGGKLVTVKYSWSPASPGEYLLQARAKNSSAAWTEYAVARVWVGEITPTPTDTATPTMTPTATSTLTVTPTVTPASASFGQPVLSTKAFQYKLDCVPDPAEVNIQVMLMNAIQGDRVYLFYRLRNNSTNELTSWNDGLNMAYLGGGTYQITVSWTMLIPVLPKHGASAEFDYQFVAFDPLGAVLLRSPVYTDITLSSCH